MSLNMYRIQKKKKNHTPIHSLHEPNKQGRFYSLIGNSVQISEI